MSAAFVFLPPPGVSRGKMLAAENGMEQAIDKDGSFNQLNMDNVSSLPKEIIKVNRNKTYHQSDFLAVEEPLEIRVSFDDSGHRAQKAVSVTMRTPGNDSELATGFLYTEGLIKNAGDVLSVQQPGPPHNTVCVELRQGILLDLKRLERNFYTTSSCGVCGKSSISAVRTICQIGETEHRDLRVEAATIYQLPEVLRNRQDIFDFTGGLHGCGLFDASGQLVLSREDVGRHNALDKLIGAALEQSLLPLHPYVLLLSGRSSFELIQKAWMAGISMVAAIGAPSSLAVQMAEELNMTLIGFLKNNVFNIYSGSHRIIHSIYENSY